MDKLQAVIESIAQSAGPRPHFLTDPDSDRLLAMVLALSGQLSTVYERLDTLERLLADKQILSPDEIDSYEPAPEVAQGRLAWNEIFVRRLLRVLSYELEALKESPDEQIAPLRGE